MSNLYFLSDMTWPEVKEALPHIKIAVVPVGAHEQHGPHINQSCDTVRALEFCKLLGARLFPEVLVTPPVNIGVSGQHLNFPGTLTLRPETLEMVLHDICASLKHHGITRFLFVNSHGGNQPALGVAAGNIRSKLGVKVAYTQFTALARKVISEHIKSEIFGHACEREVSEALYLAPEIVRLDRLSPGEVTGFPYPYMALVNAQVGVPFKMEELTKNGCLGDARKATREIGEAICMEALDNLSDFIRKFISD